MTYLVTDNCVKCKHTDCVTVCPVDCFYEGENFLAINPTECIDCGVCEPECPADAIIPLSLLEKQDPDNAEKWLEINTKHSLFWPNITQKKDPPADWSEWDGIPNKFEEHFSAKPGTGD